MKVHKQNRIEHGVSFFLSVLVNGGLLLALLHFVSTDLSENQETTTVMVIDEEEFVEIEDQIEELIQEDPVELEQFVDTDMPTFDTEIDVDFDVEQESVEIPSQVEVNQLTELLSDVVSPVQMNRLAHGRTQAAREAGLRAHGGSPATEAAVRRALDWLKENQQPDGSWRGNRAADSRTGMTGLGLLTFLAHGETTSSAKYGSTVTAALRFLVEEAQQEDGTFRYVETAANRGGVYAHAIATYALSEAYAMTKSPMIREPMIKALKVIINGQREDGGFDYQYARNGGERDRCTSVAGWQIQAMKAAHMAQVEIPGLHSALSLAIRGMKLQQRDDGRMLYASGGSQGNSRISNRKIMTAIGVLSLQILGEGNSRTVRRAMEQIGEALPEDYHDEMEPVYAWYYATQAYFHTGGSTWNRWNNHFAPMAVRSQNQDGSWNWDLGRSDNYGPVYHTTLTALTLMVYYRYLPTTNTELIQQAPRIQEAELPLDDEEVLITL